MYNGLLRLYARARVCLFMGLFDIVPRSIRRCSIVAAAARWPLFAPFRQIRCVISLPNNESELLIVAVGAIETAYARM